MSGVTDTRSNVRRTADALVALLEREGVRYVFTLSGNQIMPVFDACIGTSVQLVHVRHEAAAVHMADAWGRLTGEPGVALLTAGPGFANAVSAMYVALMSESPVLVLSGDAPRSEVGRGAFQEMAQVAIAERVTKASWLPGDGYELLSCVGRGLRQARAGRPGPVHVALPADVLESRYDRDPEPSAASGGPAWEEEAEAVDLTRLVDLLERAGRPLIVAGPRMMRGAAADRLASLERLTSAPCLGMESPRGLNDPSLGSLSRVLARADLIVLLGKKVDFTLRFGSPAAFAPSCRFVQIDADDAFLEQGRRALEGTSRLAMSTRADPGVVTEGLLRAAAQRAWPSSEWLQEVRTLVDARPPEWSAPPREGGPLHAVDVCRAVQGFLDESEDGVLIADGGEFGQWAQGCVRAPHRLINGPSGAIGSAIPFALAARLARPRARIVTMLGDGTAGFHLSEYDTAVRYQLPFVAVVGNDACWNAERQIQLKKFGPDRLIGCDLLPSRYDQAVAALGARGELVSERGQLASALERAHRAALPALVNVLVERAAAPSGK